MGKGSNHLLFNTCCYFYLHLTVDKKQISILNSGVGFFCCLVLWVFFKSESGWLFSLVESKSRNP